jgi:hypothetical protein
MAVSRARERGEQMMWVMYFATSGFEASLAASLSGTGSLSFRAAEDYHRKHNPEVCVQTARNVSLVGKSIA